MLQSMTGYGLGRASEAHLTLTVELKSLNSKGLEFHMRMPGHYMGQELMLKNLLTPALQRGKVTVQVQLQNALQSAPEAAEGYALHAPVLAAYHRQLQALRSELQLQQTAPTRLEELLHLPGVRQEPGTETHEAEVRLLEQAARQALEGLLETRQREGQILAAELHMRSQNLQRCLQQVEQWEQPRVEAVRQRLSHALREAPDSHGTLRERMEQEILFYLEKLDITEEKVRFQAHLTHFQQLLDAPESQGRKLVFLTQELWREANTLGNKAGEIHLQTLVVEMKDELEKMKEQLMNVL